MENIKIDAGQKRLRINDTDSYIEFNPSDVLFAEKYYKIYTEFQEKQNEYLERSKQLDAEKDKVDANGVPANLVEGIAFLKDVCQFVYSKIDWLFGEGSSKKLFGDTMSLDMISQFFDIITPYIKYAREEKKSIYTNPKRNGVMK